MASEQPLTLDEHTDLGRKLAEIRNELLERFTRLANAYPRTGPRSTAVRKISIALAVIDDARTALEGELFREYPEQAEITAYYPRPQPVDEAGA